MKFGKSLSNQIEETLPEWRDKFLSYKELKKRLKMIDSKQGGTTASAGEIRPTKKPKLTINGDTTTTSSAATAVAATTTTTTSEGGEKEVMMIRMTREEIDFIRLLDAELDKFNWFFEEKEEEYIIRLKELQDRVAKAKESNEELIKARKEIVDFHGEMVLLENYSALNYTGLVKILKKYDKVTGALIRLPFIQRVLRQPFFRTDVLYKLVKECEIMLDHLFPINEPSLASETTSNEEEQVSDITPSSGKKDGLLRGSKELAEIEYMESLYMKSTVSALRVLKEIRSKSSTVSVFSLPPMQTNTLEEIWNQTPVLEQTANV